MALQRMILMDMTRGDVVLDARAIAGLMAIGSQYFVNETLGSDANPGTSAAPFATLAAAQAVVKANHHDVIYITGTVHISATLSLATDGVTYKGLAAPGANSRARISQTGSAVFSPLVSVTAQNCGFENIDTFHGFNDASAQVCWADSGGRNSYLNCGFRGGGHATAAAQAGCRSLALSGSTGESVFERCHIGLDTIVRASAVNAALELTGGVPRVEFYECTFQMLASLAGQVHVNVPADGIDRRLLLDRCIFANAIESGGTTINAAVTANAAAGGAIVVRDPICLGATAFATAGPVYGNAGAIGAATSFLAIKLT